MKRITKRIGLFSIALPLLCLLAAAKGNEKNPISTILDFHPTTFEAKANSKFFYSIGQDLKYSDQIDPHTPTLLHGEIRNFLVSPDGLAIAVVANRRLMILKPGSSLLEQVSPVDSIYKTFKPFGRQFFRDDEFQWSRDSRFLFLIKDEYYRSKGTQLFSIKGELWRYEVESGKLQLIVKPFPATNYFFGSESVVYFSVPTETGSLRLKYFDEGKTESIGAAGSNAMKLGQLKSGLPESPFYSFDILDYEKAVLTSKGIRADRQTEPGITKLLARDKALVTFTQGKGWDGYYFCAETLGSVFLPGDRFLVFNTPYCGNFNGQLLIDIQTGSYQMLPKDTRVYITVNTDSYPHFQITGEGITIN